MKPAFALISAVLLNCTAPKAFSQNTNLLVSLPTGAERAFSLLITNADYLELNIFSLGEQTTNNPTVDSHFHSSFKQILKDGSFEPISALLRRTSLSDTKELDGALTAVFFGALSNSVDLADEEFRDRQIFLVCVLIKNGVNIPFEDKYLFRLRQQLVLTTNNLGKLAFPSVGFNSIAAMKNAEKGDPIFPREGYPFFPRPNFARIRLEGVGLEPSLESHYMDTNGLWRFGPLTRQGSTLRMPLQAVINPQPGRIVAWYLNGTRQTFDRKDGTLLETVSDRNALPSMGRRISIELDIFGNVRLKAYRAEPEELLYVESSDDLITWSQHLFLGNQSNLEESLEGFRSFPKQFYRAIVKDVFPDW